MVQLSDLGHTKLIRLEIDFKDGQCKFTTCQKAFEFVVMSALWCAIYNWYSVSIHHVYIECSAVITAYKHDYTVRLYNYIMVVV